METRRHTRKEIIDALIAEATQGMFTGDKRDGAAPAITLQNFSGEALRYGAKALRARLSRLSRAELCRELEASAAHVAVLEEFERDGLARLDLHDREAAARAHSQRQAEIGRRHGLQQAILAATRHHRSLSRNPKQAWRAIKKEPFEIGGETVAIDKDAMCVRSARGRKKRAGIKFKHWQNRYWPAAARGRD